MEYTITELAKATGLSVKHFKDLDLEMLPILVELNTKKYYTSYCCCGHPDREERPQTYLLFRRGYDFPIPIPLFERYKSRTIAGKRRYSKSTRSNFFEWYISRDGGFEERDELLATLLDWAQRLPAREPEYDIIYKIYGYNAANERVRLEFTRNKEVAERELERRKNSPRHKYHDIILEVQKNEIK